MGAPSRGVLAAIAVIAIALLGAAIAAGGSGHPRSPFVPSANRDPAEVWAVGDGADGSPESYAVARMIAGSKPDRFLYLGDVYPAGTAEDFATRYEPSYGRLAEITAPTLGNHEADNVEAGYDPYWRAVHGQTPPSYYAFRIAGLEILSLNSEIDHSADSPQLHWLERKVRGPGNCRIAFWHRPRFNAGEHSGDDSIESFWDALGGRAKLVLNGHDHNMQRQAGRDGIVQLISGAGGDKQYPLDPDYPGLRFASDASPGALAPPPPATARSASRSSTLTVRCSTRGHATADVSASLARVIATGYSGGLGPDQDHVGRVDPDRVAFLARRQAGPVPRPGPRGSACEPPRRSPRRRHGFLGRRRGRSGWAPLRAYRRARSGLGSGGRSDKPPAASRRLLGGFVACKATVPFRSGRREH